MAFTIFSIEEKQTFSTMAKAVRNLDFAVAFQTLSIWIKNWGWKYTLSQLYEKFANSLFDYRYGTDTRIDVELSTLQINSPNKKYGGRYHASPVYSFQKILRRLDIKFSEYTFVDFGSGKGRILLLAGELPFKQVIGVEFSENLNACAAANIAKYPKRLESTPTIFSGDATHFEFPFDNLVLYFFNPFTEEVLTKVLANLSNSLSIKPRCVIIVYLYLEYTPLLENLNGFRLSEKWRRYHIYEYNCGKQL